MVIPEGVPRASGAWLVSDLAAPGSAAWRVPVSSVPLFSFPHFTDCSLRDQPLQPHQEGSREGLGDRRQGPENDQEWLLPVWSLCPQR